MNSFSVIGAGNLGANLIHALDGSDFIFKYIYKRSKFARFSPHVENDLGKLIACSDIVVISVRESQIGEVARELALGHDLSGKVFFHTSNSLTSEELMPLKERGGIIASFSPLQTFPDFALDKKIFDGVYFLSEGDRIAVEAADRISGYLNAENLHVDAVTKIFFHIGAVISSNFLNSLLRFADIQIKKGGGYDYRILLPLVRRTLANIEKKGLGDALTGPARRNESKLIENHLELLDGDGRELYLLLNKLISD